MPSASKRPSPRLVALPPLLFQEHPRAGRQVAERPLLLRLHRKLLRRRPRGPQLARAVHVPAGTQCGWGDGARG